MKSKFFLLAFLFFCFNSLLANTGKSCTEKTLVQNKIQCVKTCSKTSAKSVKATLKSKQESRITEEENALINFVRDKILFFTRYFPDDTLLKNFFEIDSQTERPIASKFKWEPN